MGDETRRTNRGLGWILALLALLVVSNALWAYALVDAAVSFTYLRESFSSCDAALTQALALLPVAAEEGASRSTIVSSAARLAPDEDPFEKEGFIWVGGLGLEFDDRGQLVRAVRAWSAE